MKNPVEFILVGYSYGATVAIELTRLLEAKNLTGRLILIDGAPGQLKTMEEQHFSFTTIQEFQDDALLSLVDMFYSIDNEMFRSELTKHDTWEKKLDAFIKCIPDEILHAGSTENYRIYCESIYKHLLAVHEYDVTSLPPLKSPIILIKPTVLTLKFTEEDYGLSKVTEGSVQIHYVEGNHTTILENDQVAVVINGDMVEGDMDKK